MSLAGVIYQPYKKQVVCLKCLKRQDFDDLCHEHFYVQRDYRFIEAWGQKLQKEYSSLCRNKIVVARGSLREPPDIMYNDTYNILKWMGIHAYTLNSGFQKDVPLFSEDVLRKMRYKHVLLVDYNGVLQSEWQMLTRLATTYNRQVLRISIRGEDKWDA